MMGFLAFTCVLLTILIQNGFCFPNNHQIEELINEANPKTGKHYNHEIKRSIDHDSYVENNNNHESLRVRRSVEDIIESDKYDEQQLNSEEAHNPIRNRRFTNDNHDQIIERNRRSFEEKRELNADDEHARYQYENNNNNEHYLRDRRSPKNSHEDEHNQQNSTRNQRSTKDEDSSTTEESSEEQQKSKKSDSVKEHGNDHKHSLRNRRAAKHENSTSEENSSEKEQKSKNNNNSGKGNGNDHKHSLRNQRSTKDEDTASEEKSSGEQHKSKKNGHGNDHQHSLRNRRTTKKSSEEADRNGQHDLSEDGPMRNRRSTNTIVTKTFSNQNQHLDDQQPIPAR